MRRGLDFFCQFTLYGLSFTLPFVLYSSSVDDLYNLSEQYIPGRIEWEESRKVCIYPFRNRKLREDSGARPDPSVDYLSRGIPGILVTEIRKIGAIYDPDLIPNVVRHAMGPKPSNTNKLKRPIPEKLEEDRISFLQKRKTEFSQSEWEDILSGKKELKPVQDPRFIPLEVEFFREEILTPQKEDAFSLGAKHTCFYVLTGEYDRYGEDKLFSQYELTNLWDGSVMQGSLNTSFIRALQELKPLVEKIRKDLMGREISSLSIDTGQKTGALVFLDGNYLGKTPLKNHPVTVGRHELSIIEKGYKEIHQEITIQSFQEKTLSFTLIPLPRNAYLSVSSEPSGAEVFLGIESLGTTPLSKVQVPSGKNRLRLSKEGYIDYFTGVDLKYNTNHSFTIEMKPGDTDLYYKNKDYVFLDYTYKDFSTYTLWSSLVFFAGHIYFQLRANSLEDSIRPRVQIVNFGTFQAFNNQDPNLALATLAYDEFVIGQVRGDVRRYRRISGDLGIGAGTKAQFRDGPMIYGMLFSLAGSLTFLFLGLDQESLDIGFEPNAPLLDVGRSRSDFESRGYFHYRIHF